MAHISFDRVEVVVTSIEPSIIHVKPILKPTVIPLSRYDYSIEKSESQASDFKEITRFPADSREYYEDFTSEALSVNRQFFYKVKAIHKTTNVIIESGAHTWADYLDYKGLEIVRRLNYLLRYRTGTPNFLFIERTIGTKCPHCWDEATSRVKDPDCSFCLGTGKLSGYYTPVTVWADLNPSPDIVGHPPQGEVQVTQTRALFPPYPRPKPRDVIVEALNEQMWRIMSVSNKVEVDRTPIQLVCDLVLINKTDVEYKKLDIPEQLRVQLINDFNERKRDLPGREW